MEVTERPEPEQAEERDIPNEEEHKKCSKNNPEYNENAYLRHLHYLITI